MSWNVMKLAFTCRLILSRLHGKQNLWWFTDGHCTKWVSSSRSWHNVHFSVGFGAGVAPAVVLLPLNEKKNKSPRSVSNDLPRYHLITNQLMAQDLQQKVVERLRLDLMHCWLESEGRHLNWLGHLLAEPLMMSPLYLKHVVSQMIFVRSSLKLR